MKKASDVRVYVPELLTILLMRRAEVFFFLPRAAFAFARRRKLRRFGNQPRANSRRCSS